MDKNMTGAEIRQAFIDFFTEHGHTVVPSSSLVPGGDQTLLFTNAGMVQFKDVFLGTDHRPYTRAVDSQKCMRVAGKHNDLDDVGRDDTHHTFFEMLGNWSFGDYYKKEAITWAWQLLTDVFGLDKSKLWTTYFQDDKGDLPTDEEAAENWCKQPGIDPTHVLPFGRKENFWEMAETGPCGPCSEIHIDRGPEFCNKQGVPGHVCRVNGDCSRYLELWNLVFIQYNRLSVTQFEPLPATHVDTGMGLERIVSVMQGVSSNYRTDLLLPLMETVRTLAGQTEAERDANITPYRVVADHSRAATFLIADGVVPGNTGRNYVCRMIIRRAARFGTKLGLTGPFLAKVADVVVENYGAAYPELRRNRATILTNLTREEQRFQRTVDAGMSHLNDLLAEMTASGQTVLDGHKAFDLYATLGLPLELTRDVAREQGMDVDEEGFRRAMDEHRLASSAGKVFGSMGGEDVDVYRTALEELIGGGKLSKKGVQYDPYSGFEVEAPVAAFFHDGESVDAVQPGDTVEVLLPKTCFYVEAGGQVSDHGTIVSVEEPRWEIRVDDMRKPAAGVVVHSGVVVKGTPRVGDAAIASVDLDRRKAIMRNHTATHLLHAELRKILGDHARQAGSLVAPDRLRFDFTHPEAVTPEQLEQIEALVNRAILENHRLTTMVKPLQQAISEGAMALFGEKYGESVRTISIGNQDVFSYELCGGTHVHETADIGLFLITSEGSAAAGVRRIEAVTGQAAYELVQRRFKALKEIAGLMTTSADEAPAKAQVLVDDLDKAHKQLGKLRQELVALEFERKLESVPHIEGIPVLAAVLANADIDTLRQMCDRFREKFSSGVVVLGSAPENRPVLIAAVTDDLVQRGLKAGDLVKVAAQVIGGSGGGRPTLAQAGGKDASKLNEAIDQVGPFVKAKLVE
ncbi:alanyl-tRNA synthetase [Longilinea arvoryzae]|uniref:Alanine--tRNA ligase n=1 Tax=Longilinea arvoryzae TaxID=360412 RepID=A0A0S7BM96_9CHLR|nr:alanine--tRNA ligase [Longilinea arvoryzae]GAP14826.1 alanyl-tRNA synthetase [Longilinea arvoryzae]